MTSADTAIVATHRLNNLPSCLDLITKSGVKYDSVVLVYNKFVSAISYEATSIQVPGEATFKEACA